MKQPRICVSVAAEDAERAVEAMRRVDVFGPDLIEVRLDYMEKTEDLETLRPSTALPLIATNRLRGEGGRFKGSEEERIEGLIRARDAGFDYVDLELSASASIDDVRGSGAALIVSFHDLSGTPPITRLEGVLDEMLELEPDICKIVGTAQTEDDNLTYLSLVRRARAKTRIVSFGMGEAGIISRVLSPLIGGEYTHASAASGEETAPGQMSIEMLRELYRLLGCEG